MNKELLKQQLLRRYKPQPRRMDDGRAKALLAKYGQKYNPAGSTAQSTPTATATE